MGVTELECLLEYVLLNVIQEGVYALSQSVKTYGLFLQGIATHNLYGAVLKVASAHYHAYWHTFQLVVGKLKSRTLVVGIVIFHGYALSLQRVYYWLELLGYLLLLLALADRYDNHLQRCETWRQNKSVIVGVGHDERTDKTC